MKGYYEELLKNSRPQITGDQEKLWDLRADDFNNMLKRTGRNKYADACLELFLQKGFLSSESRALDIGCGPGRYVVSFARKIKNVTGTDISSRMLALLEQNAKEAGLDNVELVKLDWTKASKKESLFQKRFDFVYAIQSPGAGDMASIRKMMDASCSYCMTGYFVYRKDSVEEAIKAVLDTTTRRDPHNNRDRIQAIFNLLWMDGYTPELTYIDDSDNMELTKAEALDFYGRRFSAAPEVDEDRIKNIIDKLSVSDTISVSMESSMAFIIWHV